MAATGSTLQLVAIPASSIAGQDLAQVKNAFVAGSAPGFAGIKCSAKQVAGAKTRRAVVARAADGVQQQTAGVESASVEVAPAVSQEISAPFANLSASVSAPSPTQAAPTGPFTLGVGLAVAAGLVFIGKNLGPKPAPKKAPAAPAPSSKSLAPTPSPPRSVTQAAPAALKAMSQHFPNAMEDQAFVRACAKELFSLGFSRDNCIALVNTCRDEVCRPLASFIDNEFGLSFNIAGLGGLINCGKTGFGAAFAHSPIFPCDVDGKPRERYVFFAFPHVSVGETGEVGSLLRRGRGKPSSACGALIAIRNDAKAGKLVSEDPDDPEYCLLKTKVLGSKNCTSCEPSALDLVTVTNGALEAISDDLETLIAKTVNPSTADYAVITGVQIHSGNQVPGETFRLDRTIDYVSPGKMYAVIRGKRYDMQVSSGSNVKVAETVSA